MDAQTLVAKAQEIATRVITPAAAEHDRAGTFPREAVTALGEAGLLGLNVLKEFGGAGLGPRALADVTAVLAEADASVGMIYVMHLMGTACIAAAGKRFETTLRAIAKGNHLTTLAFSERGSRSHFWAPVSRATKTPDGVRINAMKSFSTSAGQADS